MKKLLMMGAVLALPLASLGAAPGDQPESLGWVGGMVPAGGSSVSIASFRNQGVSREKPIASSIESTPPMSGARYLRT